MTRPGFFRGGFISVSVCLAIAACAPAQSTAPTAKTEAPKAEAAKPTTAAAQASKPSEAAPAATSAGSSWDQVVADGKKEGTVVKSAFSPSVGGEELLNKKFEETYGIKVEESVQRSGDYMARYQAESAANKIGVDVRSSSSAECRDLAQQGLLQSYGTLPAAEEPGVPWIFDPVADAKQGKGDTLTRTNGLWFIPVNNRLIPPDQQPKSYKDLADPKYKGMIVMDEPGPVSFGTLWAASSWDSYGEQYVRDVLANTKSLSRNGPEAMSQTMQGVYGIYIMANSTALVDLMKLPEPRPVSLVKPSDGYMSSTGSWCIAKGAPHPNAAKVYLNYTLTQEAQQILAGYPGGSFIRRDVTPAIPDLAPQISPDIKFFHENPNSYDFQVGNRKYFIYGEKTAALLPEFGLK
jgi:iron(III) transport system substrate-binding protein